jgi:hypothetical protein
MTEDLRAGRQRRPCAQLSVTSCAAGVALAAVVALRAIVARFSHRGLTRRSAADLALPRSDADCRALLLAATSLASI